jgi:hypothetical protein
MKRRWVPERRPKLKPDEFVKAKDERAQKFAEIAKRNRAYIEEERAKREERDMRVTASVAAEVKQLRDEIKELREELANAGNGKSR